LPKWVEDAGNAVKETAGKVAGGVSDFYQEHKETIKVVAAVALTVTAVALVVVGTVATGGLGGAIATAAVAATKVGTVAKVATVIVKGSGVIKSAVGTAKGVALIGAGVGMIEGGISCGISNALGGDDFYNGYIGGTFNGGISGYGSASKRPYAGNGIGGFVGTLVTGALKMGFGGGLDKLTNQEIFPTFLQGDITDKINRIFLDSIKGTFGYGMGTPISLLSNELVTGDMKNIKENSKE